MRFWRAGVREQAWRGKDATRSMADLSSGRSACWVQSWGGSEARPAFLIFSVANFPGRIGVGAPETMTADSEGSFRFAGGGGHGFRVVDVAGQFFGPHLYQAVAVFRSDAGWEVCPQDGVREGPAGG